VAAKSGVLGRAAALEVREDPVQLLCNTLVGKTSEVPAPPLDQPTRRRSTVGSGLWGVGEARVTCCDALALTKKAVKQAKADAE
jgi:hypothetical protein